MGLEVVRRCGLCHPEHFDDAQCMLDSGSLTSRARLRC